MLDFLWRSDTIICRIMFVQTYHIETEERIHKSF